MTPRFALALLGLSVFLTMSAPATAGQDSDVEEGRRIFEANCAMCHGADASGMMGMHPSLRGAVERLSVEGVQVTIREGRDTNPPMPAFEDRLTEREIDQVTTYLDTLPPGPRNFGPDSDGDGMMDGMMGGWMWLLPILVVVASALALLAIVRGVRARRNASGGPSPRDVLDERYAAGEIDRDEYLERRDDLER